MNCHFAGMKMGIPPTVTCGGPAVAIAHDRRGCQLVCEAHAKWIATTSTMLGHSPECPERDTKTWQRVTRLGTGK